MWHIGGCVGCATFVYCERSGGCPVANGKTLLQGQCDLKADAAVTANPNAPVEVFGRGPAVTLTSGTFTYRKASVTSRDSACIQYVLRHTTCVLYSCLKTVTSLPYNPQ